tara:strand:- start:53 stop:199 length:147 start_codon:yes stop_codon:yes gene_type:complete
MKKKKAEIEREIKIFQKARATLDRKRSVRLWQKLGNRIAYLERKLKQL